MKNTLHDIVLNTTPFSNPLYQPPWCYRMCLRQPFQLLTSLPVPVKDNTCNKNENETFAAKNEKKKLKLDEISATKNERKKERRK